MKKLRNPLSRKKTALRYFSILAVLFICTTYFSAIHAQCPMPAPPVYTITSITTDAEDYCSGDDITATANVDAGLGGTDWFIDWEVNFMGMGWMPAGTDPTCPYMLANDVLVYTPPANMTCASQQIEFRAYVYHKVEQTNIVNNQNYIGDDDPLVDTDGVCAGSANNTCSTINLTPVNPTGLARLCNLVYSGDGTTEGFNPSMARDFHSGLILADGTCNNTDGDGIFDPGANRPWDFMGDEDLTCSTIALGDMYQICVIDDNMNDMGQAGMEGADGLINDLCIQTFYWDAPAAPLGTAVDIFPNPANFVVSETQGGCDMAANVVITAENGDVCFEVTGNIPTGCGDSQPLTYEYDPMFGNCNMIFNGTVEASCNNGSGSGSADAGSLNGQ